LNDLGLARQDKARHGQAWLGSARLGAARQGKEMHPKDRGPDMGNSNSKILKRTVETQMILNRLLDLEKGGDGVTIQELQALVGDHNLYAKRRHIIASARLLAEDLAGMNLEWKDGAIRALSDEETAKLGYIRKVRSVADRGLLKSSRIEKFDDLSENDKVTLTCARTIMSLLKAQTTHQSLKKLEAKIKQSEEKLDLQTQLKMFLE
jgi:hypothetical protein